jgi:uncharacterized membrane protein YfcA
VLAGAVNAAIGSGTLLTYPLLLAAGLPPVVANGTNSLGLTPGNISGAWGYRREVAGRRGVITRMAVAMCVGAGLGAALVLALPARVFASVVPWLILAACVLVLLQPRLVRAMRTRGWTAGHLPRPALLPALLATGVYAGYFGAAQGIVLIGVLGTLYDHDLQLTNGAKNVMQATGNAVAAVLFAFAGVVSWPAAVAVGAGSLVGGLVGAPLARRMPDAALRALIVGVGLVAAAVSLRRL